MRKLSFLAAVHSVETDEKQKIATFYIMNTSMNLNRWGVSDKGLEEANPTLLRKPIGCGPEYKIDDHYPDPMNVGKFIRVDKPDGYSLGSAEIADDYVWEKLNSGEWGPISVVIHSYLETCSLCGEDITEDPWGHDHIASEEGYIVVENFVFKRVDFIDAPGYPQAGLVKLADHPEQVIPLELLAKFYESQSKVDGPQGAQGSDPNPEEKEKEKRMEAKLEELQQELETLKAENTTLTSKNEELEERLEQIETERHQELVDKAVEARAEAGLVKDRSAEAERLKELDDKTLTLLAEDAGKVAEKLAKAKPTGPKAKYTAIDKSAFDEAVEETRMRLFGHCKEENN